MRDWLTDLQSLAERATVAASAPGKLVLSGEYAVLRDAPAVCMAVNRRAVVTATASEADHHELRAPGLHAGSWRFRASEERIEWLDSLPEPTSFLLFERLWARLPPVPECSWLLTLDSSALADRQSGRKLGLGGSAAIAVALAAVLRRLAGVDDAPQLVADIHSDVQGGRGSGVDIACSRHGGLIEYRRAEALRPGTLRWPPGFACGFLWSGTVARTADKLARLGTSGASRVGSDRLAQQAEQVAASWRAGEASMLLASLRDYVHALLEFDHDQALGIFAAGHDALVERALASEVVYKPCGAGGGDIGAVFAVDGAAVAEFTTWAQTQGFAPIEMSVDDNGVMTVNTADA